MISPLVSTHNSSQRTQQFYSFLQEEYTQVNGKEEREDRSSIMLYSLEPVQEFNKVHWETFRNLYWSTCMSDSEKVLRKQLSLIISDLQLILTPEGKIHDLVNLSEIQKKAEQIIIKLSKNYIGNRAEKGFQAYRNFYSNKKHIISSLYSYNHFGLLLSSFYEEVYKTKNANLMDNIIFTIEEQRKINNAEIKISGKLIEQHNLSDLHESAKLSGIKVLKGDIPKLEKYDGIFYLRPDGFIKSSSLSIIFSFGENYKKTIDYTLNAISHEEI